MAWYILNPIGVRRRAAVFAIVPILAAYAILTGLSASCVRAAIIGALVVMAQLFRPTRARLQQPRRCRRVDPSWDTNRLFSPGFQFSFVLVFTIVWLSPTHSGRLERVGAPIRFCLVLSGRRTTSRSPGSNLFAASLGITLSAMGSLLFTAGYFHLSALSDSTTWPRCRSRFPSRARPGERP